MADDKSNIPPDEFATWLLPKAALGLLSHLDYRTAKQKIVDRARNGLLRAGAETSKVTHGRKTQQYDLIELPSSFWSDAGTQVFESGFWASGDGIFEIHTPGTSVAMQSTIQLALFALKFDPAGLQKMLPPRVKDADAPAEAAQPTAKHEPAEVEEGPPVSATDLKAWFDLYSRVYPNKSEPHAVKSAQGMFHDKSVPRQRVRELFGERKRGRKPDNSAD